MLRARLHGFRGFWVFGFGGESSDACALRRRAAPLSWAVVMMGSRATSQVHALRRSTAMFIKYI
jgi:hypothetical protein